MEIKIDGWDYKHCCDKVKKHLDGIYVKDGDLCDVPNPDIIVDEILEALGIKA